jgi:hypothetical protein
MLSGCPDCGGNKFQYRPQSHVPTDPSGTDEFDDAGTDPGTHDIIEGESDGPGPPETEPSPPDAGSSPPGAGSPASDATDPTETPDATDPTETPDATDPTETPDATDPTETLEQSDSPQTRDAPSTAEPSSGRSPPESTGVGASPDGPDGRGPGPDPESESKAARTDADGDREDRAQADARTGVVSPDELASAAARGSSPPDVASDEARVVEPSSDDHPSIDELREELNDQFESIRILDQGQYELNLMELYNRDEYIISLQEDGRYVIEVPESWRSPPDSDE